MLILITRHFSKKYIYQIEKMTSQRKKYRFLSLLPQECISRFFFEMFYYICKATTSTDNSAFKNVQFLAVAYDMVFSNCAVGVV